MQPVANVTIRGNELLWRYMSVARFEDVITTSRLYFAAATQFPDEFEGAVAIMPPEFPVDPRYEEMEPDERAFYGLKRLTKISCWHRAEYESNMMWKLYGDTDKGVAIRSTYDRMQAACKRVRLAPTYGDETIYAGPVTYVDFGRVRLRPIHDVRRFFYKHLAFATEQEFRFAISLAGAVDGGAGGDVPEEGVRVEIDTDTDVLVECVVLARTAAFRCRPRTHRSVRGHGTSRRQGSAFGLIGSPALHLAPIMREGVDSGETQGPPVW